MRSIPLFLHPSMLRLLCAGPESMNLHKPLPAQEPDEGMRMRGSLGTDVEQHYVDDGLQQALDGLHRAHLHLLKDVSDMAELIAPPRAETRYLKWKKPRFPISTYKTINR